LKHCAKIGLEYLEWAYNLKPSQYASARALVGTNLYTLQEIVTVMEQYDKKNMQPYMQAFQKHAQIYQQASAVSKAGMQQ